MTTTVTVPLGDRAYEVRIGAGVRTGVAESLPPGCARVLVVADRAVLDLGREVIAQLRRAGLWARLHGVVGGEGLKTWSNAGALVRRCSEARLARGDAIVAVGGGTVGDLAGFAAAVYLRGIAVVHLPTTLLAMVDSAIGGKTGVNLPRGKNLAGAFWQPAAVLCDLDALDRLPVRAYRSAFAEIVKCSMVADAQLAHLLDDHQAELEARAPEVIAEVVRRCCAVKAAVVAEDEREGGRRAILNYGHTVGHALEALTGYGDRLTHGEAVAAGMRVAAALSVAEAGCPEADAVWQDGALKRWGLGTSPRFAPAQVLEHTRGDKKARDGRVRWVLVERIGSARAGMALEDAQVLQALEVLR